MFKYYYTAFQKSVLSHETYQVLQGKDATYQGSKDAITNREGSILLLATADAIITKLLNSADNGDSSGFIGFIINLLIKAAEEVWDLLENYLVPAIVVDDVSLTDVPSKLKGLKNNVSGTLMVSSVSTSAQASSANSSSQPSSYPGLSSQGSAS